MKKKAFIYIILAGILWGTSGIFVKLLSPYGITPFQMTAVRGTVSSACMFVFALIKDRSLLKIKPTDIVFFALIGLSLFGTGGCYYTSMQMTSVSTAVILMYTAPVYVMIFSVLFLGEKFSKLKLVSIVCMLAGCCLVSGMIGGLKFNVAGILIGVLSGISYAAYNILTKIAMRRGFTAVTATMYSFVFMAVIALSFSSPIDIVYAAKNDPLPLIPMLIALGIVTHVLPYLFYTLSMKSLPVGTVSALGIVEPMAATIFSVILFKEKLDIFSASGIILILAAVFLLAKAEDTAEE